MIVEARIVDVLETWPPQLVVHTESGRVDVALSPSTVVTADGDSAHLGELAPGMRITVYGDAADSGRMVADRISLTR